MTTTQPPPNPLAEFSRAISPTFISLGLLLTITAQATDSTTAPACTAAIKDTLAHFAFRDRTDELRFARDPNGVYLAQGTTARVYLSRHPNDPNRIVAKKIYELSRSFMELDVRIQTEFVRLAERTHGGIGFRFAKMEISPVVYENAALVEYVPGKTLHQLLRDPEIEAPLKEKLSALYLERLSKVEAALRAASADPRMERAQPKPVYFKSGEVDGMPMLKGQIAGKEFILKTDNIIVDPRDLTMTVIDPI